MGILALAWGRSVDAQSCSGGRHARGGSGSYYSGQGWNSLASQSYSPLQQAVTNNTLASANNPVTVLAHATDLKLTSTQVQQLKSMLNSGQRQAARVLTMAQRKKLAMILGSARKSGSS
jgi:hypothetical protein